MNGRGWPNDDVAAPRRLVAAGWADARIGEEFDPARESVQRKRVALRLKLGHSPAMRRLKARRMARSSP